jgi:hypothetical protein
MQFMTILRVRGWGQPAAPASFPQIGEGAGDELAGRGPVGQSEGGRDPIEPGPAGEPQPDRLALPGRESVNQPPEVGPGDRLQRVALLSPQPRRRVAAVEVVEVGRRERVPAGLGQQVADALAGQPDRPPGPRPAVYRTVRPGRDDDGEPGDLQRIGHQGGPDLHPPDDMPGDPVVGPVEDTGEIQLEAGAEGRAHWVTFRLRPRAPLGRRPGRGG